jgi:radical SAM/Cys-rich protein
MKPSIQISTLGGLSPKFVEQTGVIYAESIDTLQINVGKWCNQTCRHCHVDASPIRQEKMTPEVALKCISLMEEFKDIKTVDLTGGAPEGHEVFKDLVLAARRLGKNVIDRCNLTILSEPGFEWLPEFLHDNQVEVVCSLPHFSSSRTDKQRGNGVFERSIEGLKILNQLGYGTKLKLHLVYNPSGLFLSDNQESLQREFKTQLKNKYDVVFNDLYCINNLPVSRFLESLVRANKLETYHETLVNAFNPQTINGLMCRHQINVGWDGHVYDCDFNQMLDLKAKPIAHLIDFDKEKWISRKIKTLNHCYGCTAGAGSSCGGEIA